MRSQKRDTAKGRFNQHMQRQMGGACTQQGLFGSNHVVHRFHLGHHDVAQALTSRAGNDVDIACKAGWSVACTRAATRAVAEAPEASEATRRACSTSCPTGRRLRNPASRPPRKRQTLRSAQPASAGSCACELPHRCSDRTQAMPVHPPGRRAVFHGVECVHHQLQGYVQCPGEKNRVATANRKQGPQHVSHRSQIESC